LTEKIKEDRTLLSSQASLRQMFPIFPKKTVRTLLSSQASFRQMIPIFPEKTVRVKYRPKKVKEKTKKTEPCSLLRPLLGRRFSSSLRKQ
jgi:hypothetical protein